MPSLSIGILLSVASGNGHGLRNEYPEVKELNVGFKRFTCNFSCKGQPMDGNSVGKKSFRKIIRKGKGKECQTYCHSNQSTPTRNPVRLPPKVPTSGNPTSGPKSTSQVPIGGLPRNQKPNASRVADNSMFLVPSNAAHAYPKDKFYEKERNIQAIHKSIVALHNLQRGEGQERAILCYDWENQSVVSAAENSLCEGLSNSGYIIKVETDKDVDGFYPLVKAYPVNESNAVSQMKTEIKKKYQQNLNIKSINTLPVHQGKRLAVLLCILSMKAFKHFHDGDVELHNLSMHNWIYAHKKETGSDGPGGDIKKCRAFFAGTKAYLTASRAAGFLYFEIKDGSKPIDSGLDRIEEEINACGRDGEYEYRKKMEEWGHSMKFSSILDDDW